MSVVRLPHNGKYVQLGLNETQIVFGWSATDCKVHAPQEPEATDSNIDEVWVDGDEKYQNVIAAMLSALKDALSESAMAIIRNGGGDLPPLRINVPPEVAAHLRATSRTSLTGVMGYSEAESPDGQPVVLIPLGKTNPWRHAYSVRLIAVSPGYTGIEIGAV